MPLNISSSLYEFAVRNLLCGVSTPFLVHFHSSDLKGNRSIVLDDLLATVGLVLLF